MPMVRRADGSTYYESRYGTPGILDGQRTQGSRPALDDQRQQDDTSGGEARESGPGGKAGPGTAAAVGKGVGTAMGAAGVPGGRTASGIAADATQGRFDPAKTGINLGIDVASALAPGYGGLLGAGVGIGMGAYQGGVQGAVKAGVQTATSMLGGMIGGPFGALIGGYLGSQAVSSYDDGMIGDALDSRRHEALRDYGETQGWDDRTMRENVQEMDREVDRGKPRAAPTRAVLVNHLAICHSATIAIRLAMMTLRAMETTIHPIAIQIVTAGATMVLAVIESNL